MTRENYSATVMEIQIEAIAVEAKSQRESCKVTMNPMVVPPNLPDSSLEEFDISET